MASLVQVVLNEFGLRGVRASSFKSDGAKSLGQTLSDFPAQQSAESNSQNSDGADAKITSWLGTPVWADVRLFPPGREDLILDTVLVTISQRKNIVTTPVQGRSGTIKEYISAGDYDINFKGALVNSARGQYPELLMRDLRSVLIQDASIKVVSDFLRLFDVYEIVVTDYSFQPSEGFQNMQLFEFTALSDTPIELILEEDV